MLNGLCRLILSCVKTPQQGSVGELQPAPAVLGPDTDILEAVSAVKRGKKDCPSAIQARLHSTGHGIASTCVRSHLNALSLTIKYCHQGLPGIACGEYRQLG